MISSVIAKTYLKNCKNMFLRANRFPKTFTITKFGKTMIFYLIYHTRKTIFIKYLQISFTRFLKMEVQKCFKFLKTTAVAPLRLKKIDFLEKQWLMVKIA